MFSIWCSEPLVQIFTHILQGLQKAVKLNSKLSRINMQKSGTNSAHEGNVPPEKRARQYSEVFYADGGKLFCKVCNVVVNHIRKSTCDNHITSRKHQQVKFVKLFDLNSIVYCLLIQFLSLFYSKKYHLSLIN